MDRERMNYTEGGCLNCRHVVDASQYEGERELYCTHSSRFDTEPFWEWLEEAREAGRQVGETGRCDFWEVEDSDE